MRLRSRLCLLAVSLCFPLLTACPDEMPNLPDPLHDSNGLQNAEPASLIPLSLTEAGDYADLVQAPDGTLHALFQAVAQGSQQFQAVYRFSQDGGESWSAPEVISTPEQRVGFLRLALDSDSRLYAFWKPFRGFDIVNPSGGNAGSLFYRVRDGGAWQAPQTLGTPEQVVSWWPTVDPSGNLHVLWSEALPQAGGRFGPDWQAGRLRQARFEQGAPTAITELRGVSAEPAEWSQHTGYQGLNGYVDAEGVAHFVALKHPADQAQGTPTTPQEVVYFNGSQETSLFRVSDLEAPTLPVTRHPPQLWRDGDGQEHLLMLKQAGEQTALQDYDPAGVRPPVNVYQLQQPGGGIRAFQLARGAQGEGAVLLEMHDTGKADAYPELFVSPYRQGWQTPQNMTRNSERSSFSSSESGEDTQFSKLVNYSARYAAGSFAQDGRLNLLAVNTVLTMLMRESDDFEDAGFAVSNSASEVAFLQR